MTKNEKEKRREEK